MDLNKINRMWQERDEAQEYYNMMRLASWQIKMERLKRFGVV